jgi:NAD+ synthase
MPFETLDAVWYGWEKDYPVQEIADGLGLKQEQVQNIINDIKRKIAGTEYLRMNPL